VGGSKRLYETLTNSGESSVTISQATITGGGFSLTGLNLPLSLAEGKSITFSVIFAPKSSGNAHGTISVASNASDPTLAIPLSGNTTPAGKLTLGPATLNFGSVTVRTSKNLTTTLSYLSFARTEKSH
jgi:hypothetical protein